MTILETPIIIPKASKSLVFTSNNPPDPTRSLTCVTQEPAFELRTHQALPLWKLPAMGGITNAQSQLIKAILWHSFEHLQVCCWHFFCQFFFCSIFTYYTLIVPLFDSPPPSPTFSDAMVSAFSAQYARDFDLQNSRPARWKFGTLTLPTADASQQGGAGTSGSAAPNWMSSHKTQSDGPGSRSKMHGDDPWWDVAGDTPKHREFSRCFSRKISKISRGLPWVTKKTTWHGCTIRMLTQSSHVHRSHSPPGGFQANWVSGMDHVKNPSELFARNHACNAKKSGTHCSTGTQGTYS